MRKNKHIEELMKNMRILPANDRDQTGMIFRAYSACVQDLSGSDPEIFGQKKLSVKASVGVKNG